MRQAVLSLCLLVGVVCAAEIAVRDGPAVVAGNALQPAAPSAKSGSFDSITVENPYADLLSNKNGASMDEDVAVNLGASGPCNLGNAETCPVPAQANANLQPLTADKLTDGTPVPLDRKVKGCHAAPSQWQCNANGPVTHPLFAKSAQSFALELGLQIGTEMNRDLSRNPQIEKQLKHQETLEQEMRKQNGAAPEPVAQPIGASSSCFEQAPPDLLLRAGEAWEIQRKTYDIEDPLTWAPTSSTEDDACHGALPKVGEFLNFDWAEYGTGPNPYAHMNNRYKVVSVQRPPTRWDEFFPADPQRPNQLKELEANQGRKYRVPTFVAVDEKSKVVWVAVRGSHSIVDWLMDFNFFATKLELDGHFLGNVHLGFHNAWAKLNPYGKVMKELKRLGPDAKLAVTGHSLGGAVAQLMALALALRTGVTPTLFTFGSPRVGDAEFRKNMQERVLHYRFRNRWDFVPLVPMQMPGSLQASETNQGKIFSPFGPSDPSDQLRVNLFTLNFGGDGSVSIPPNTRLTRYVHTGDISIRFKHEKDADKPKNDKPQESAVDKNVCPPNRVAPTFTDFKITCAHDDADPWFSEGLFVIAGNGATDHTDYGKVLYRVNIGEVTPKAPEFSGPPTPKHLITMIK